MGRKKIYTTFDQKRLANNLNRMKYYWKNQKREKQKSLNRYYENKGNLQNNK